jgi:hypothetical protein
LSCLESCELETLDEKAAQSLIPGLCAPFDLAIYMPLAMSIQPKRYLQVSFIPFFKLLCFFFLSFMKAITIHLHFILQALFSACQILANDVSKSNGNERTINLQMQNVCNLQQLSGHY